MTDTGTTPQHDTRPVSVPFWALELFVEYVANDDRWNHADGTDRGQAFNALAAAKNAALGHPPQATAPPPPPLPPAPGVLEIRTGGRLVAEVYQGADGRLVCDLPAPVEPVVAGPLDTLADGPAEPLPAHHFDERYDEDGSGPADVFPGHVDPDAAF